MYNLEINENLLATVKIVVEGEEFKSAKEEILNKFKNTQIDGFRKGKAPLDVVEKHFEGQIREEIFTKLINKEFSKAIEEKNVEPVSRLEVVSDNITKDKVEAVITFAVRPEFELPEYKGLEVEIDDLPEVDDEAVNKSVENVAARLKTYEKVEGKDTAEKGDIVNINFEGFVDGTAFEGGKSENFDLELGSHSFIDTFEDQIVGHKLDEEFEVNVKFPEEYHAENLKGKPAMFKVKLNSIKEVKMPEINDELAKKQGYDTLEDYKTFVKSNLEAQRLEQLNNMKYQKVIDKIVKSATITVPEVLITEEKDREIEAFKKQLAQYGQNLETFLTSSKKTMEEFEKDALGKAEEVVKFRLIASEIIKKENLEVTKDDINEQLNNMATGYNMTREQLVEELKKMNILENYTNEIANNIIGGKLKDLLLTK
ncbi:trigger factor [Oceanivirga salmonicida]|uniref:trigger factor n=1 Tax=Oceanivirga salmonicida TaxID=1769291 RepID=UPI0008341FCE|nr:trigger factor [Oceanivirga salmonicida]